MAIDKAVKVPQKEISSVDIVGFGAGLNLNGAQSAPLNSFIDAKDVQVTSDGYLSPRDVLTPWLPDTVETTYQKLPVTWQGQTYYFTLDENRVKFCQQGDLDWTDCGPVPVAASLTTALTGANNDLAFTADTAGPDGNDITIAYVNPGTPSAALSVSVAGTAITVHLATNGSSVITSTASLVLAALNASTAAAALINTALAPANTGAGVVTALTTTPLTGGTGTNFVTTNNGGKPELIRILDCVMVLNGTNGDKICYADLSTGGFPVVKYALVDDPPDPLTETLVNLSTGAFNIYYAFTYSGATGETLLSPIDTISVNIVRDQWRVNNASPSSIKLTRPGSPPAGAQFWNLYVAVAATGGSIADTDMLQLATKLDLSTVDFVDDGSLSINLGSLAPIENSTDGPRVDHGIVEDGNPILFGDVDHSENIWIGGGGPNALSFSVSNNGYLSQPEQGTNFVPTVIIGFRNGQGQPALTVLFSNTEGLSKQSVLEQQTVNYGDQSFSVWGVTEQHYGAAGVAATSSAINYNGKLLFFSTDGVLSADTQPAKQNVLSINSISAKAIDAYIRRIKTSAMPEIVGAGWNNKFMWLVPSDGFDSPQQILISDDNNGGAWYTHNIPGQWIGTMAPPNTAAFIYICQGKSTYKLNPGSGTFDTKNGVSVPFSTKATGPLVSMKGQAHNQWQADVQTMFYILGLVGDITIGINYRNQNGKIKTKKKVFHGPVFAPIAVGGWGDTEWSYSGFPQIPGYASSPTIEASKGAITSQDVRIPIQVDDIMNEAQWFYFTNTGYSAYKIRAISFEGIDLGVRPDLQ